MTAGRFRTRSAPFKEVMDCSSYTICLAADVLVVLAVDFRVVFASVFASLDWDFWVG